MAKVATTSSTKLQPTSSTELQSPATISITSTILSPTIVSTSVLDTSVSTSIFDTIVVHTLVLDSSSFPVSIPSVGAISLFTASPIVSTIVSIPDSKVLSTMTVGPKAQPSTRLLSKDRVIEEDIDLDEEIEIPKWDFYNLTIDQMHTVDELLQNKAK